VRVKKEFASSFKSHLESLRFKDGLLGFAIVT